MSLKLGNDPAKCATIAPPHAGMDFVAGPFYGDRTAVSLKELLMREVRWLVSSVTLAGAMALTGSAAMGGAVPDPSAADSAPDATTTSPVAELAQDFEPQNEIAEIPGHLQTRTAAELVTIREMEFNRIRTSPDRVSVFVHMKPDAGKGSAERNELHGFATAIGGRVQYEYGAAMPNTLNLRNIPQVDLARLKAMPGVASIEMDEYVDSALYLHDSTPLIRGLQSQITGAGLSADGAGVRICVVDTGIDSDHLMYSTRIDTAAGRDFHNGDNNPEDDNGHGSHVSGIALGGAGLSVDFGCGAGSEPFQGVAPAATLIGCKVLNASGGGFSSNIVAGIDYCANQSPTGGRADVINMSIGTGNFAGPCTHAWAVAANNAAAAGVVPVAASGNENNANSMGSPACGVDVISVGATYKANYPTCEDNLSSINWGNCVDSSPILTDEVVCFSNESDFLDVSAPGAIIWSASNAAGGGSIVGQAGTSMASPQVAGLAALILGEDPSLTPAEVRQIIRDGAIDLGPAGFDRAYGWGRIDVINSLQLVGGGGGCTSDPECDDGLFCNGAETCNLGTGNCQSGSAPNCNDGVACTDDSCNEGTDSCNNVANNANCDDGLFCNGDETCHATLGCQAGTDPCAPEPCNEGSDTCGAGAEVWITFLDSASVPVVGTVQNEDIVAYDTTTGTWSWVFDGSDVGLSSFAIDGLAVLPNGNLLLSFTAAGTIGGVSSDDSDILQFAPTSLGSATAGTFSMYFDGSDVGLTTNNEDIDSISLDATGRLVISTLGAFSVTGASGNDEDLIVFNATSLGSTTAGTWQMYFDGSDVGLTATAENVDGTGITSSGSILLSTTGNYAVTGASGANEDLFEFFPTLLGGTTTGSFANFLDLSTIGIATGEDVTALELVE